MFNPSWASSLGTNLSGFSGLGAGLASGFGGAAAGAGGAAAGGLGGAASGLLGLAGGPVGLIAGLGMGVFGAGAATQAAEASMKNAQRQAKTGFVANLAGQEFLKNQEYGRQMQSLRDQAIARQAGYYGPQDFQDLLSTGGVTASAARKDLYGPIYRRM
jgi:hypothetical protein